MKIKVTRGVSEHVAGIEFLFDDCLHREILLNVREGLE